MLSITLRQLEYAVAIETHGGVSAAAAALNVSQPALSVALHQIESQLGKPLFLRRAGGPMAPTSFGREFLARARSLLDDANSLLRVSATIARTPVVLGIFEDLAPLLLAPVLAMLQQKLPEVEVRWRTCRFEEVSASTGAPGGLDLAITYNVGLDISFLRHELLRLPLQVVVARGHPFARRGTASIADVAGEPIILTDHGLSRAHMLKVFDQHGLYPKIAHNAGTMETMRSLAANKLGVGLSYTSPRAATSYDGKPVRHITISDSRSVEPVLLIQARDNALSPAAESVRALITTMRFEP